MIFFLFLVYVVCVFGFDIVEATIPEIQAAFESKELNCETLIRTHIERIVEYNSKVHAVITINPEAILTAKKYDRGERFGSLWCIPTLLKDNIDIVNLPSTGGSVSLSNSYPKEDAPLVKVLKESGVIVVGKANMAEFAADGMNTNTTIGGQTLNLYCHDRTPYGSSGGVGAGITASFAVIGIGTDTCGSVVNPSSAASLVGLRPDRNHTNNMGIIPLNFDQDVYGIMMRSASDVALVWDVIKHVSPTPPIPKLWRNQFQKKNQKITKIGFMSDFLVKTPIMDPDQDVIDIVNKHLTELQSKGYQVVQLAEFSKITKELTPYFESATICGTDLAMYFMNEYFNVSKVVYTIPDLKTLIEADTYGRSLVSFLTQVLENGKNPFDDPECQKYQTLRSLLRNLNLEILNDIDIFIYPSANQKAPLLDQLPHLASGEEITMESVIAGGYNGGSGNKKQIIGFMSTCINSAWSGLPSINYPIGYTADNSRSPFGMNAIGVDEDILIQFSVEMEKTFSYRKAPPMP